MFGLGYVGLAMGRRDGLVPGPYPDFTPYVCLWGSDFRMESVTESVTSTQAEQRAPLGYLTRETLFQGVWITRHANTELEKLSTRAHGAVPQTGNTLVGV